MAFTVINPATGEEVRSYDEISPDETRRIIDHCDETFLSWKKTSFGERAKLMKQAAEVLRKNSEKYSALMTLEMGKPITQSRSEIEKCAFVCDFYAENAEKFLTPEVIKTEAKKSYASYQPLGVVLAIMPWNFPLWQVFRFLAPALMAGNAGLLKHAPNVPGSAIAIEEVILEAGFPEGLFKNLLVDTPQIPDIIANPLVRAVTMTASTRAGKAVATEAGKNMKKCVFELGGSDAYIVLEDADLELAASTCVASRMINTGQSCVAAKRFIVLEPVYKKFTELYVELMKAKKMGDPTLEDTDVGPIARFDLRDGLADQVDRSVKDGATVALGGKVPDDPGAYYPPTVLTDVHEDITSFKEELFGPVASIIPAKDEADAIQKANNCIYGLGGAVFTQDLERGERIAEKEIEAGCCFVNSFVKSDPRLPFGGIKESGYGRELSHHGIQEFTNIKTIYIS